MSSAFATEPGSDRDFGSSRTKRRGAATLVKQPHPSGDTASSSGAFEPPNKSLPPSEQPLPPGLPPPSEPPTTPEVAPKTRRAAAIVPNNLRDTTNDSSAAQPPVPSDGYPPHSTPSAPVSDPMALPAAPGARRVAAIVPISRVLSNETGPASEPFTVSPSDPILAEPSVNQVSQVAPKPRRPAAIIPNARDTTTDPMNFQPNKPLPSGELAPKPMPPVRVSSEPAVPKSRRAAPILPRSRDKTNHSELAAKPRTMSLAPVATEPTTSFLTVSREITTNSGSLQPNYTPLPPSELAAQPENVGSAPVAGEPTAPKPRRAAAILPASRDTASPSASFHINSKPPPPADLSSQPTDMSPAQTADAAPSPEVAPKSRRAAAILPASRDGAKPPGGFPPNNRPLPPGEFTAQPDAMSSAPFPSEASSIDPLPKSSRPAAILPKSRNTSNATIKLAARPSMSPAAVLAEPSASVLVPPGVPKSRQAAALASTFRDTPNDAGRLHINNTLFPLVESVAQPRSISPAPALTEPSAHVLAHGAHKSGGAAEFLATSIKTPSYVGSSLFNHKPFSPGELPARPRPLSPAPPLVEPSAPVVAANSAPQPQPSAPDLAPHGAPKSRRAAAFLATPKDMSNDAGSSHFNNEPMPPGDVEAQPRAMSPSTALAGPPLAPHVASKSRRAAASLPTSKDSTNNSRSSHFDNAPLPPGELAAQPTAMLPIPAFAASSAPVVVSLGAPKSRRAAAFLATSKDMKNDSGNTHFDNSSLPPGDMAAQPRDMLPAHGSAGASAPVQASRKAPKSRRVAAFLATSNDSTNHSSSFQLESTPLPEVEPGAKSTPPIQASSPILPAPASNANSKSRRAAAIVVPKGPPPQSEDSTGRKPADTTASIASTGVPFPTPFADKPLHRAEDPTTTDKPEDTPHTMAGVPRARRLASSRLKQSTSGQSTEQPKVVEDSGPASIVGPLGLVDGRAKSPRSSLHSICSIPEERPASTPAAIMVERAAGHGQLNASLSASLGLEGSNAACGLGQAQGPLSSLGSRSDHSRKPGLRGRKGDLETSLNSSYHMPTHNSQKRKPGLSGRHASSRVALSSDDSMIGLNSNLALTSTRKLGFAAGGTSARLTRSNTSPIPTRKGLRVLSVRKASRGKSQDDTAPILKRDLGSRLLSVGGSNHNPIQDSRGKMKAGETAGKRKPGLSGRHASSRMALSSDDSLIGLNSNMALTSTRKLGFAAGGASARLSRKNTSPIPTRSFGLRVLSVREVPPAQSQDDSGQSGGDLAPLPNRNIGTNAASFRELANMQKPGLKGRQASERVSLSASTPSGMITSRESDTKVHGLIGHKPSESLSFMSMPEAERKSSEASLAERIVGSGGHPIPESARHEAAKAFCQDQDAASPTSLGRAVTLATYQPRSRAAMMAASEQHSSERLTTASSSESKATALPEPTDTGPKNKFLSRPVVQGKSPVRTIRSLSPGPSSSAKSRRGLRKKKGEDDSLTGSSNHAAIPKKNVTADDILAGKSSNSAGTKYGKRGSGHASDDTPCKRLNLERVISDDIASCKGLNLERGISGEYGWVHSKNPDSRRCSEAMSEVSMNDISDTTTGLHDIRRSFDLDLDESNRQNRARPKGRNSALKRNNSYGDSERRTSEVSGLSDSVQSRRVVRRNRTDNDDPMDASIYSAASTATPGAFSVTGRGLRRGKAKTEDPEMGGSAHSALSSGTRRSNASQVGAHAAKGRGLGKKKIGAGEGGSSRSLDTATAGGTAVPSGSGLRAMRRQARENAKARSGVRSLSPAPGLRQNHAPSKDGMNLGTNSTNKHSPPQSSVGPASKAGMKIVTGDSPPPTKLSPQGTFGSATSSVMATRLLGELVEVGHIAVAMKTPNGDEKEAEVETPSAGRKESENIAYASINPCEEEQVIQRRISSGIRFNDDGVADKNVIPPGYDGPGAYSGAPGNQYNRNCSLEFDNLNAIANPRGSSKSLFAGDELEDVSVSPIGGHPKETWSRKSLYLACGVLLVIILVIVVVTVVVSGETSSSSEAAATLNQETESPSALIPLDFDESVLPTLANSTVAASTIAAIMEDSSSPQALAFSWMAEDPHLANYSDWRRLQRFALVTFYFSLNGPNWKASDEQAKHWLDYEVEHECLWFAYENACGSDGHVQYLKVNRLSQFRGSVPPEIVLLEKLHEIDLSTNILNTEYGRLFPKELPPVLRILRCSQCRLKGSLPSQVGLASSLQAMVLKENEITGSLPSEMGQLTLLDSLLLNDNKITGNLPSELGGMGPMINLVLDSNQISGRIPIELTQFPILEYLGIGFNALSGRVPSQIGLLSRLARIDMEGNSFTGPLPSQIGLLGRLSLLDCLGTGLDGPIPSQIGQLKTLHFLSMTKNSLTGTIPTQLGVATALTSLDLAHNKLTGTVPSELGQLLNLDELHLSNNALTGPIPTEIATLQLSLLEYNR